MSSALSALITAAVTANPLPSPEGANKYRGFSGAARSSESGEVTREDVRTLKLVLSGRYAILEDLIPAKGGIFSDYAGYEVSSSTLTPQKGGLGKLSITLVTSTPDAPEDPDPLTETVEVDMSQIEKPLLSHPSVPDGGALNIELWRNEPDAALKKAWSYMEGETLRELTEDEIVWAGKIAAGVESYLLFAPVVTLTGTYASAPTALSVGSLGTPPISVSGYQYLKTGDHVAQNSDRSWTRTQKWTGADRWDADIYGGA